jgi:hypothetical protein
MDKLFAIQLASSFFIGGGLISLLSYLVEKTNKKMAGLILGFPTTVGLGFFFLGWSVSPEAVSEVAASTLIPFGLSVLFAASYGFIAEYFNSVTKNKYLEVFFTLIISIGFWLLISIPLGIYKFDNLYIGIFVYLLLSCLSHYLLKLRDTNKAISLQYNTNQKIARAATVGTVIFLVVLSGKLLNPFWGGILSVFPAAFASVLVIIHLNYNYEFIFSSTKNMPIGSLSIFSYILSAMFFFKEYGFILGTISSYLVSLLTTLVLIKVKKT